MWYKSLIAWTSYGFSYWLHDQENYENARINCTAGKIKINDKLMTGVNNLFLFFSSRYFTRKRKHVLRVSIEF